MHLKTTVAALGVAASIALTAGAASAATITTFTFDLANSGTQDSLSYTLNGLTLSLTTTGGVEKIETWRNSGLGAPLDSHHQVDSRVNPETINLSFDKKVSIHNITFNPYYVQSWDRFVLSEDGSVIGGNREVKPSVDVTTGMAQIFGIGAVGSMLSDWTKAKLDKDSSLACYEEDDRGRGRNKEYKFECFSAFKITSVTVKWHEPEEPPPNVVPLPAAGWMLLAGLGGIAAMKRRRKAA